MLKKVRVYLIILVIGTLVSTSFNLSAFAQDELGEPSVFNTFVDAVIYRPVSPVSIPVGFEIFVLSLPFSATGGNISTSFDKLVVLPTKYTFNRPL